MADYRQVGRAFAITLSNEITATLMVESGVKMEILSAMDMFLENATVLPNMPNNKVLWPLSPRFWPSSVT